MNHESSWKVESKVGLFATGFEYSDRLHVRNAHNSRISVLHRASRNESRHLTGAEGIEQCEGTVYPGRKSRVTVMTRG